MPAALLTLLSLAAADGLSRPAASPAAWLGQRLDPGSTPFCREHRCRLSGVRRNTPLTLGWHDGTQRTYTLRGGQRLDVDVRPAGWISNARLRRPQPRGQDSGRPLTPAEQQLAAQFLSAVTGRTFQAAAVAACEKAGRALPDPDAVSPAPLSVWTTPQGLPFKARCGVRSATGVWVGWQQQ